MPRTFDEWFSSLTSHPKARNWQVALAEEARVRSRLIRIPTGLGKTEGVLAAWSYHRIERHDDAWPRRLVWCLPMRVLVEQTFEVAQTLCAAMPEDQRPGVDLLMGGEDGGEWFLNPEKPWILIGTQDMLLSRAMNRGYGSARARWPIEFGLLNQDSLWVMDEVQLMDVGLATSAQIQAYRDFDETSSLRPVHTWWMSATLQPDWLRSVDTARQQELWAASPCQVPAEERTGGLWEISKSLQSDVIAAEDHRAFADRVKAEHATTPQTEFGKITLVVCNTVDRATALFEKLQQAPISDTVELVHGRFRPMERVPWRERFLSRPSCTASANRIIVATQVVEAGVDISAGCLISELAPWPSLVQRFGRCARYGGSGRVIVIDRGQEEKDARPYEPEELTSAWNAVSSLKDVGIKSLEAFEGDLDDEGRAALYPYRPAHLLMQNEFEELFDTTPDLTGADLDISRFIRSGEERDLMVFWVDVAKGEAPANTRQPLRSELCAIPFLKARDWLCGTETKTNRKPKLRKGMRAWIWDWIDGEWTEARRDQLWPGRMVCVAAECGGYTIEQGFSLDSDERVTTMPPQPSPEAVDLADKSDNQHDGEPLSFSEWKTIACHTAEVVNEVSRIAASMFLPDNLQRVMKLAARWHDIGKSHPAFQGALKSTNQELRPPRNDLAKGPQVAWRRPPNMYRIEQESGLAELRPSFRHELASLMAVYSVLRQFQPDHSALLGPWGDVFQQMGIELNLKPTLNDPPAEVRELLNCNAEEFDLIAYLVVSHHGKVRVALHASPSDQEFPLAAGDLCGRPIRGVRNGDALPSVSLTPQSPAIPELPLMLDIASLGLSARMGRSWRERCQSLREIYGLSSLALLEAIFRAADVSASRLKTEDMFLTSEVTA